MLLCFVLGLLFGTLDIWLVAMISWFISSLIVGEITAISFTALYCIILFIDIVIFVIQYRRSENVTKKD